jgi:hypothetical protein
MYDMKAYRLKSNEEVTKAFDEEEKQYNELDCTELNKELPSGFKMSIIIPKIGDK